MTAAIALKDSGSGTLDVGLTITVAAASFYPPNRNRLSAY